MNSNKITEEYFDRILLTPRLIDSDLPDMTTKFLGETFATPIMTAALSHLHRTTEFGMEKLAEAAKMAGACYFCGMTEDDEIERIQATGAKVVSIIKPHADNNEIIRQIEHAKKIGVFAVGVDIDHAYTGRGTYDVVEGYPCKPKTKADLRELVKAAEGLPFVIKGVLSVPDAVKCVEVGVSAAVISHHSSIMESCVPPAMILPEIKKAVGSELELAADCCVDSGMDAFKLLALGADAICVGKDLMPPLKEGQVQGAYDEIMKLTNELKTVMARTGYRTVSGINSDCIRIL